MNKTIIVAHDESHETIDCPHCDESLCIYYPADWWEFGEICETTHYATGFAHVCPAE